MSNFEEIVQRHFFSGIRFSDERERQVFLSYLRGFTILIFDQEVRTILEIGGGQSTALLAEYGQILDWNIITIDLNPDAIEQKIRNQTLSNKACDNINFIKGISINAHEIHQYYNREIEKLGNVSFREALYAAKRFINTKMDDRKVKKVAQVFEFNEFQADLIVEQIIRNQKFSTDLLNVFRTPHDELDYQTSPDNEQGCLSEIMDSEKVDVVFLDSGEFSSLPEWEIIVLKLRLGGYVVLHDIFFPKSFKNWVVCGSILANPNFKILYVDFSIPQGLMVAQKIG